MRGLLSLLTVAACFSFGQPFAAVAETNAPAPLPPAAQEALNKGIIAAKEGGYIVAIRYLQDARKLAPQAPQIFRSLGAVEAKIPGRELRAIAWYGAYLAALPNAPDAAEVNKEIVRLEVKSQITISGLITSVQDAASQISDDMDIKRRYADIDANRPRSVYLDKSTRLAAIAELWAKAGDIAAAAKTARLIQDTPTKSSARIAIAEAQLKADDIVGALKTADLIQGDYNGIGRAEVQIEIDHDAIQRASSDIRGTIAEAQAKSGDIAGAQTTADLIADTATKSKAQVAIADAQSKLADVAGAQNTLVLAQKTAALIQHAAIKSQTLKAIAEAQAKSGDIADAQKTADFIQDKFWKDSAQEAIDAAKAKNGVADAANSNRPPTSNAATPAQRAAAISDWLKRLDSEDSDCPLNTAPFLDLAGYLKSRPPSNDPYAVFQSLLGDGMTITGAQIVVYQFLKEQAKQ